MSYVFRNGHQTKAAPAVEEAQLEHTRYTKFCLEGEVVQNLPRKECPIEGCDWSGRRLDMHLKGTEHRLKNWWKPAIVCLLIVFEEYLGLSLDVISTFAANDKDAWIEILERLLFMMVRLGKHHYRDAIMIFSSSSTSPSNTPIQPASHIFSSPSTSPSATSSKPESPIFSRPPAAKDERKNRKRVLESSSEEEGAEQDEAEEEQGDEIGNEEEDDADEEEQDDDDDDSDMSVDDQAEGTFSSEEDQGDEEEMGDARGKYGSSCQACDVMQALLKGWNLHLASPDGGCKSDRNIKQMCQQVESIYIACGKPASMGQIFDKDLIYNSFFKPNMEKREEDKSKGLSGNSLVVYIHHFRLFAHFMPSWRD
ncbi:hypothetical protein QZH41_000653 [Actinostola sp. cb2023]|nr:hypothetical protein QZH41_000653 [Actinostola sp. cb2023]